MSPRTGRPTNAPKSSRLDMRVSDAELEMLDYCCKVTGLTKAEVVRQGIKKVYAEALEKQKKK